MKLSSKHHRAIVGLMTLDTIAEAAKNAGVVERTVYNWLNDSDFRQALAEAEAQAVAAAARSIAEGSKEAVNLLREIMNDSEATKREKLAAANSILAHTPKLRLLGSLEQAIEELKKNDDTKST